MAKRVFFSFHYADIIRANVVKNHWITKSDSEEAGFFDGSLSEKAKTIGDDAVKRLINEGLKYTSNTCVLIGSETYLRPWVRYEIFKSLDNNNYVFGIQINSIPDFNKSTKSEGRNPLDYLGVQHNGRHWVPVEFNGSNWYTFNLLSNISFRSDLQFIETHKIYKLSTFYKVFNWNSDVGYDNFSKWVK